MNYAVLTESNPALPDANAFVFIDGIVDAQLPNAPGRVYIVAANDGGARVLAPSGKTIKLGAAEAAGLHTAESNALLTLACLPDGNWTATGDLWEPAGW